MYKRVCVCVCVRARARVGAVVVLLKVKVLLILYEIFWSREYCLLCKGIPPKKQSRRNDDLDDDKCQMCNSLL